jgi:hypothetical protein
VTREDPTVTHQLRHDHHRNPSDYGDHFVITYDHLHDHSDQRPKDSDQEGPLKYIEHAHGTSLM